MARYKLIDHWRRRRVRAHVPLDDVADGLWVDPETAGEAKADLDRLLAGLPARQERLVRDVGLDRWLRVTIGTPEQMQALVAAMSGLEDLRESG